MQIKTLKKYIEENNVPDTAEIYILSDTTNEVFADEINLTRSNIYTQNELVWEDLCCDLEEIYDENVLSNYDKHGNITAICICGFGE